MTLVLSSTERFIHYEPAPVGACPGKDNAAIELAAYLANPPDQPATYCTMLASWQGNVTCIVCRAWLNARKRVRKTTFRKRGKYGDNKRKEKNT